MNSKLSISILSQLGIWTKTSSTDEVVQKATLIFILTVRGDLRCHNRVQLPKRSSEMIKVISVEHSLFRDANKAIPALLAGPTALTRLRDQN